MTGAGRGPDFSKPYRADERSAATPQGPVAGTKETESSGRLITPRALILGVVVMAAIVFIVAWAELITGQIMIGFLQLPPVVVAATFVLVLANRLAARLSPRLALNGREMLVIYCFMLFASMITSRGLMEDLIPGQVGLNYYANEANKWQELYFKYVKPWMVPWDPAGGPGQPVATGFFESLRPGQSLPWAAWLLPTGMWIVLVLFVYAFMLFASSLLYRLWADHELLSFPLVQLPLEMISPKHSSGFLRNKLTWLGFALPVVIFGLNGMHNIWPTIPSINLQVRLNHYFRSKPWSDLGYTTMFLSPAAVGFFYMLPSELLFSLWAFFIIIRSQEIVGSLFGMPMRVWWHSTAKAFVASQTMGAYFVLVAYMAYSAWPRLRALVRGEDEAARQGNLLISPPVALAGMALSAVGILLWVSAAGMSLPAAVLEFGVFLLVEAVIMARSTAESGLPMTEGSFTPLDVYQIAARPQTLGPSNLTMIAYMDALFSRDLRGLVITGFLDAQKMADGVGARRSSLAAVFVLAILLAIPMATVIHLYLPYRYGGVNMYSYIYRHNATTQFWRENAGYMQGIGEFHWDVPIWFAVGAIATAWLSLMRRQFVWWPFHPLAYALSASWTVTIFWFPIFVAWLLKTALGRYGGVKMYHRSRPYFLGLIFGEFSMAVFWTLVSALFSTRAPAFPWP
ncbi:MAG: hypothetical protein J7M26_04750 [Armatimonadetes bacterium]|nr:hypothetical protein [Armatimonadota bacterium]